MYIRTQVQAYVNKVRYEDRHYADRKSWVLHDFTVWVTSEHV